MEHLKTSEMVLYGHDVKFPSLLNKLPKKKMQNKIKHHQRGLKTDIAQVCKSSEF